MLQFLSLEPEDLVAGAYRVSARRGDSRRPLFDAIDLQTDGVVTLQWLSALAWNSPEEIERFHVEVEMLARIEHPHVLKVHRAIQHEGHLYLVTTQLDGVSLQKRLDERAFAIHDALSMGLHVANALRTVHDAGLFHGALSPESILIKEPGEGSSANPFVMDFGFTRLKAGERTDLSICTRQLHAYTSMAPEQLTGAKVDARTDVYGLAAVLYRLLTGRVPVEANNPIDLALRLSQVAPTPIRTYAQDVDPELAAVIDASLARDPADRPANLDRLVRALTPIGAHAPASAPLVITGTNDRRRLIPRAHLQQAIAEGLAERERRAREAASQTQPQSTGSGAVAGEPLRMPESRPRSRTALIVLVVLVLLGSVLVATFSVGNTPRSAQPGAAKQRQPTETAPTQPQATERQPGSSPDSSDWE